MSNVRRVKSSEILILVELPWRALYQNNQTTQSAVLVSSNLVLGIYLRGFLPLETQLVRNIAHILEHVANAQRAKRRHQNPMSDTPTALSMVGREQTIVGQHS